jgi:hypothetical protein
MQWDRNTDKTTDIATIRQNWPWYRFSENIISYVNTNTERETHL